VSGARKSRVSKERERRFGKRPRAIRDPLPVVLVVSDDAQTAPAYFGQLRQEYKQKLMIAVVPTPCGGATISTIMAYARQQRKALREGQGGQAADAVWVLIDTEGNPALHAQAFEAQKTGASGLGVAISIPCYEVWTLLHLEDTGRHFDDCGKVLGRIKALWKERFRRDFGRKKAQADYSKILPSRQEAHERARKHWEGEDQSRTEVFRVLESIEAAARANTARPRAATRAPSRRR
jgi:hypothetical protein